MRHSDNLDGTFTNPLIWSDYPDPDIIRVGEEFYMASSSSRTLRESRSAVRGIS